MKSLKKSVLVFIFFVASACKWNGENKTITMFSTYFCEIQVLKGHVKELKQSFEVHASDPETETIKFDPNGNQVEMSRSDNRGLEYASIYKYKYDAEGKKIEAVANGGELYKYNQNGYITELVLDAKDTLYKRYKFKYNVAGDMIESKVFGEVRVFKYDSRHLLIESDAHFGNKYFNKPDFSAKMNCEYKSFDAVGNWIRMVTHYKGWTDTVTRKITYY